VDYASSNVANTAYVRRARIVAIRKQSLELFSSAADAEVNPTNTLTDYVTLPFTPSAAGDYLLTWTAESMGQYGNKTYLKSRLNGVNVDEGQILARADASYDSYSSFAVVNLPASPQTMSLAAMKDGLGSNNIRRCRVTALRLTGSRFADFASAADDTESTTASTAFVQKLSKTWSSGAMGNWLVLASARMSITTTSQQFEARVQYNDSATLADIARTNQGTDELKNFACVGIQSISAGGRQADIDYRSANASYTAKIKYAHLVLLPLDSGGGQPPTITTTSLPADTVGIAYSQTLQATGGTTPYTWSVDSGSLPAGLSLTASTGVISGTPTTSGTSNFTVKVTDSLSATATQALSIVVNAAPNITTSSLPADTINVAYNQTLAATGGTAPLTWSVSTGSLPAGLSLNASTGAITGTPTATGTSSFTARVTDSVGATATKALSIVINAAPSITTASLPGATISTAYSQTLTSTGGTAPLTWSVSSGSLPAGLSLNSSTGAITASPSATGTSSFTARVTDAVGAYASQALSIVVSALPSITTASLPADTINVAYSQTLAATGGTAPLVWSISSGTLPAGLSLNSSTGAITGTPTASGTSNFTARVTDNVGALASQALSIVVNAAPSITTASLPADTINVAYSQTLAATGGTAPLTWSLSSGTLPAGLSLNSSTGAITGTPTTSGTSNFTARVTDNAGASATKALSIVINAAVSITTTSLPNGTVNTAYSQTLAATGGTAPLAWSVYSGNLPAGLSLNSSTGAITGTPTTAGTSNFTARATDIVGAYASQALSITVNAQPLTITTASLPAATVTAAYSQTLAATGGVTPYTWSIDTGSLPAGLSLAASTGVISGTPTASGTSNFTVKVTDSQGTPATATKALSIVVNAAPSITTASLPADTVNVAYSQTMAATGGTAPLAWSLSSGSLPTGLSLNSSTGAITGTPTASGTSNFTARATDANGANGTKALSIVINAAVSITTATLPNGTVNTAYSQTLAATGGTAPLAWSLSSGSLPAGLSLNASTGSITGTPTATGTASFTARATDSVGAFGTQALSITVNAAGPQTYYVATNGSDSYDGSSGSPWLTIQRAVDAIGAGDTIIVRSGSYAGFRVRSSGTSGGVKTVKSETQFGAVITSAGALCTTPSFVEVKNDTPSNGVSYWVVDGFETTGSANFGIEMDYGDHVTLKNSRAHNSAMAGVMMAFSNYCTLEANESYSAASGSGFYIGNSGDNCVIRANSSHNNPSNGTLITNDTPGTGDNILSGWVVEKNSFYSNAKFMTVDGLETSVIRNNLGYGQNKGLYLLGYESAISPRDNRILNNTVVNTAGGWHCVSIHRSTAGLNEATGNKVWNNVLYNYDTAGTRGSITVDTAAETGFGSDYNVVMSVFGLDENAQILNLSQWQSRGYDTHSIQAADTALFVNAAGNDYHLSSTSPAKNAGTTLADVTDDKDGNARPQGTAYDIGCYEVLATIPDLVITTASVPNGQIGVAYSQTLAATGGVTPYSWSTVSGALPAGLSLSSGGVISGTPSASGTSNFTVRVTDSQTTPDTADKALSINVPADLAVTTASVPNGQIGVVYSQTLAATGGVTPYSWSLASGSLPNGLSLSSGGVISGTPTTAGTFSFTARATDSQTPADTATRALSISIPADLVVTTASLPNGTVAVAYSQTLAATGGVTPYAWSTVGGTLPSGLSLSSGGVISGTPAASGTSNFTVRATDSQSPADTDDQALSITVDTAVASTYEFAANDTEVSTTSTAWQTRTTLTFTPTVADTWVILAFAEYKGSSASYSTLVRMTVDGVAEGEITVEPKTSSDYQTFTAAKAASLTAAGHTVTLEYASENAAATARLRNARIVAIRKAALEVSSSAADASANLTTTLSNYVTLNFTPATAGDYLLIWNAEVYGNTTSYSTQVQAKLGGTILDECLVEAKDVSDWWTFGSCAVVNCPASAQALTVTAAKESGSSATHSIRKARVTAIRLSGGRFNNYQYASADTESTTTSTTFQEKLTKSWTATAGNWLVLTSFRLANTSANYNAEGRVQLDDATTSAQPLRQPQDATDYMNAGSMDVRNLAAGTRKLDVDYRSGTSGRTAKVRYVHAVAVPLQ
jgi:hypothetical protein